MQRASGVTEYDRVNVQQDSVGCTSDSKRSARLQIFVCGALVGSSTYLGLQMSVDLSSSCCGEKSRMCERSSTVPCQFAPREHTVLGRPATRMRASTSIAIPASRLHGKLNFEQHYKPIECHTPAEEKRGRTGHPLRDLGLLAQ